MDTPDLVPVDRSSTQPGPSTETEFEEVILLCEGQEFTLPKECIAQSPVLSAAFRGNFVEASTNTINVVDFNAMTVGRLVEYLIHGDYNVNVGEIGDWPRIQYDDYEQQKPDDTGVVLSSHNQNVVLKPHDICTNDMILRQISVSQIADYYGIPELMDFARGRILQLLDKSWSSWGYLDVVDIALSGSIGDNQLCHALTQALVGHTQDLDHLTLNLWTADCTDQQEMAWRSLLSRILSTCGNQINYLAQKVENKSRELGATYRNIERLQYELSKSQKNERKTIAGLMDAQKLINNTLQSVNAPAKRPENVPRASGRGRGR